MSDKLTISENNFLKTVIDLGKLYGWRIAHFRHALQRDGRYLTPVQADGAGFPDLVMTREGRLITAELKTERGKLTWKQAVWLDDLAPCAEVYVWRPSDWDKIEEILR